MIDCLIQRLRRAKAKVTKGRLCEGYATEECHGTVRFAARGGCVSEIFRESQINNRSGLTSGDVECVENNKDKEREGVSHHCDTLEPTTPTSRKLRRSKPYSRL